MCLPGSAQNNAPQWEHIVRSENIVSDESSRRRQYQLFSLWSVSQQSFQPHSGNQGLTPNPSKSMEIFPSMSADLSFYTGPGPQDWILLALGGDAL